MRQRELRAGRSHRVARLERASDRYRRPERTTRNTGAQHRRDLGLKKLEQLWNRDLPITIRTDRCRRWIPFRARTDASDGFILVPHITPGGLDRFADVVVPLLREAGVFRTEYTGTTLRDHLGLARP